MPNRNQPFATGTEPHNLAGLLVAGQRNTLPDPVALPIDHIKQRCVGGAGDQIRMSGRGSNTGYRTRQQNVINDAAFCLT